VSDEFQKGLAACMNLEAWSKGTEDEDEDEEEGGKNRRKEKRQEAQLF